MFYKDDQEIIIRQCDVLGKSSDVRANKWVYVSKDDKVRLRHTIEQKITRIIVENRYLCYFKNEEINFVSEVMNRVPMFCNFLTASAYKRILFVGHDDASKYFWFVNNKKFTGKRTLEDDFPPERSDEKYFPEMNTMFQFIPLLLEHLKYQTGGMYVMPTESRHHGIVQKLYYEMLLDGYLGVDRRFNAMTAKKQYKHGEGFNIEDHWDGIPFDAVVFLGVPSEKEFTLEDVRKEFKPYIKPDCHFVDFWYGNEESYSKRFINAGHNEIQAERSLGEVMAVRGAWDKKVKTNGRGAEYDLMKKWIKIYTND